MSALEHWPIRGEPDNPSAWLYRSAYNNLISEFRHVTRRQRILKENRDKSIHTSEEEQQVFLPDEGDDDMLRTLFACCDDTLPAESQLVLIQWQGLVASSRVTRG